MKGGGLGWMIVTSSSVDHRVPVAAFNGGLECADSVQRSLLSPPRWIGQIRVGCDCPVSVLLRKRTNKRG